MKGIIFLKNLYKKFLDFEKKNYLKDIKNFLGVKELKLSQKEFSLVYDNYQKSSFLSFLKRTKDLVFSKDVFDFILKNITEDWDFYKHLYFLKKENLIGFKRERLFLKKPEVFSLIPRPKSEEEIIRIIEKKTKKKIRKKEKVSDFFFSFKVKGQWDQMPISQESAVFVVKKILDYLPLNKKFLFIGDDDFISLFLSLVDPSIESMVVDIDEDLLEKIRNFSEKFNLKIETRKVDLLKTKNLGESFVGFLINPVYTLEGVQKFMSFGLSHFSLDGGYVFLELGDEAIGNRFLFFQDFFTKKNLILRELILKKVYYPQISLHKEDKIIERRMKKLFSQKTLEKKPKLGAGFFVFEYLPFPLKKIKIKKKFYSYL